MGSEWNLAKSRFWPFFLIILYVKIVYNIVRYFICSFFFTINSPIRWVNQSVQKELRKFMYGNHDSINFVSFCNQKRYTMITRIIGFFSNSHHTRSIQNTVFGYKKALKIESIVISIEELFYFFFNNLIWQSNWCIDREKEPKNKVPCNDIYYFYL